MVKWVLKDSQEKKGAQVSLDIKDNRVKKVTKVTRVRRSDTYIIIVPYVHAFKLNCHFILKSVRNL